MNPEWSEYIVNSNKKYTQAQPVHLHPSAAKLVKLQCNNLAECLYGTSLNIKAFNKFMEKSDSSFRMLLWKTSVKTKLKKNPQSRTSPPPRQQQNISNISSVHTWQCTWIKQSKSLWQGVTETQLGTVLPMCSIRGLEDSFMWWLNIFRNWTQRNPKLELRCQGYFLYFSNSFFSFSYCLFCLRFFVFCFVLFGEGGMFGLVSGCLFGWCFFFTLLVLWKSHEGNTVLTQFQKGKGKITPLLFSVLLFLLSACCMLVSQTVFLWVHFHCCANNNLLDESKVFSLCSILSTPVFDSYFSPFAGSISCPLHWHF